MDAYDGQPLKPATDYVIRVGYALPDTPDSEILWTDTEFSTVACSFPRRQLMVKLAAHRGLTPAAGYLGKEPRPDVEDSIEISWTPVLGKEWCVHLNYEVEAQWSWGDGVKTVVGHGAVDDFVDLGSDGHFGLESDSGDRRRSGGSVEEDERAGKGAYASYWARRDEADLSNPTSSLEVLLTTHDVTARFSLRTLLNDLVGHDVAQRIAEQFRPDLALTAHTRLHGIKPLNFEFTVKCVNPNLTTEYTVPVETVNYVLEPAGVGAAAWSAVAARKLAVPGAKTVLDGSHYNHPVEHQLGISHGKPGSLWPKGRFLVRAVDVKKELPSEVKSEVVAIKVEDGFDIASTDSGISMLSDGAHEELGLGMIVGPWMEADDEVPNLAAKREAGIVDEEVANGKVPQDVATAMEVDELQPEKELALGYTADAPSGKTEELLSRESTDDQQIPPELEVPAELAALAELLPPDLDWSDPLIQAAIHELLDDPTAVPFVPVRIAVDEMEVDEGVVEEGGEKGEPEGAAATELGPEAEAGIEELNVARDSVAAPAAAEVSVQPAELEAETTAGEDASRPLALEEPTTVSTAQPSESELSQALSDLQRLLDLPSALELLPSAADGVAMTETASVTGIVAADDLIERERAVAAPEPVNVDSVVAEVPVKTLVDEQTQEQPVAVEAPIEKPSVVSAPALAEAPAAETSAPTKVAAEETSAVATKPIATEAASNPPPTPKVKTGPQPKAGPKPKATPKPKAVATKPTKAPEAPTPAPPQPPLPAGPTQSAQTESVGEPPKQLSPPRRTPKPIKPPSTQPLEPIIKPESEASVAAPLQRPAENKPVVSAPDRTPVLPLSAPSPAKAPPSTADAPPPTIKPVALRAIDKSEAPKTPDVPVAQQSSTTSVPRQKLILPEVIKLHPRLPITPVPLPDTKVPFAEPKKPARKPSESKLPELKAPEPKLPEPQPSEPKLSEQKSPGPKPPAGDNNKRPRTEESGPETKPAAEVAIVKKPRVEEAIMVVETATGSRKRGRPPKARPSLVSELAGLVPRASSVPPMGLPRISTPPIPERPSTPSIFELASKASGVAPAELEIAVALASGTSRLLSASLAGSSAGSAASGTPPNELEIAQAGVGDGTKKTGRGKGWRKKSAVGEFSASESMAAATPGEKRPRASSPPSTEKRAKLSGAVPTFETPSAVVGIGANLPKRGVRSVEDAWMFQLPYGRRIMVFNSDPAFEGWWLGRAMFYQNIITSDLPSSERERGRGATPRARGMSPANDDHEGLEDGEESRRQRVLPVAKQVVRLKIHYEGYSDKYDEWIILDDAGRERIRGFKKVKPTEKELASVKVGTRGVEDDAMWADADRAQRKFGGYRSIIAAFDMLN